MRLSLTLPLPANLANSRLHWRVKHAQRQTYFGDCQARLLAKQLPAPPAQPWPRVLVSAVLTLGARMDDDNAMARCKWALDWCKQAGYILDDRQTACWWSGLPVQRVSRTEPHSLTLTFELVGAEARA
jgi:hypothetical protein